jgi:hypothetical protein
MTVPLYTACTYLSFHLKLCHAPLTALRCSIHMVQLLLHCMMRLPDGIMSSCGLIELGLQFLDLALRHIHVVLRGQQFTPQPLKLLLLVLQVLLQKDSVTPATKYMQGLTCLCNAMAH